MQNPYTSRNMIKERDAFFGRNREIEEIFTNLNQGFQNTSIVGERRSGKSSLLWYVSQPDVYQQYASDDNNPFLFIFFDLQRVAGLTQNAFFKLLSKNLVIQLPSDDVYTLDREDFDSWQEYFAELILEACEDFRIVICLDEFETVATSEDFNQGFLQNMRSYANQGQVAYITSSKEPLDAICQTTEHIMGSDFWNIFIAPLYLGLLESNKAHALITEPSNKAGISFAQSEVEWILDIAGHHPLFLQIACFHLFEAKHKKREAGDNSPINNVERYQVCSDFAMAAAPHFDYIWKRLSPIAKKVLAQSTDIDLDGEHKHVVNNLCNRGLLVQDVKLRPFCQGFAQFLSENYKSERQTADESASGPFPLPAVSEQIDYTRHFTLTPQPCVAHPKCSRLDVWIGQNGQVLLNLEGSHSIATFCPNPAKFDANTIRRFDTRVHNIAQIDDWRLEKQEIGRDVVELFDPIPELSQIYTEGRAIVGEDERFLITLKCPKEMIAFPFEFINSLSGVDDGLKHLALCHPLRKSILGIRTRKSPLASDFYTNQHGKMLFVSSNVSGKVVVSNKPYALPPIPGADREVQNIERNISDLRNTGKIACTANFRYNVTYNEMVDLLQYGEYDIIHYSGHGFFSDSPENSCLFFWDAPGGSQGTNRIVTLSATELNTMVERTKTRFIYLSCCQGGSAGGVEHLLYNDFLGISHSLVVGGVPAVLAMRWPLSDDMAVLLATAFYRELFDGNGVELSLFRARRRLQAKNPNDYNWLSPMLIVQGD